MKAKKKTKNRTNGRYHGNEKCYKFANKITTDIDTVFAQWGWNKLPKRLNINTCLGMYGRGLEQNKKLLCNIRIFLRNSIKYLAKTKKHPEVLIIFRQQLRKLKYANEKRFEWRTY